MESNVLLTCRISNGIYTSECSLIRASAIKYAIEVINDPLAVFEDFELQSRQFDHIKSQKVVDMFKEICLDAYTCHGSFSIEEVRRNGEEIEFSIE